jgi:hypothetical protein
VLGPDVDAQLDLLDRAINTTDGLAPMAALIRGGAIDFHAGNAQRLERAIHVTLLRAGILNKRGGREGDGENDGEDLGKESRLHGAVYIRQPFSSISFSGFTGV